MENGESVCPVKGTVWATSTTRKECPINQKTDVNDKHPFSLYNFIWGGGGAGRGSSKSPLTEASASASSTISDKKEENVATAAAAAAAAAASPPEDYNKDINDMNFGQQRMPDQHISLSQRRIVSTIPKSEFSPTHQPKGVESWVYPSEQQYFNAMKKKGYNPNEEDVGVILAIHNMVNEQGWSQIKEWEAMRGCANPRLKRFMGRPKDLSPKARLLSFFL